MRVLALALALVACTPSDPGPIPGVRLGMAPRDVRDRFEAGKDGTWQTRVGTGGDTALEWTAASPAAPLASARFEFHNGMLVALRARYGGDAPGEPLRVTTNTVTARTRAPDGGTAVTLLARDCPTHHDEAEALVKSAGGTRPPR